jgi:hypothetical protein
MPTEPPADPYALVRTYGGGHGTLSRAFEGTSIEFPNARYGR